MQNNRCFRSRPLFTAALLTLAMIAGCSDTTKRDTGKNLRKDTAAARVLYDQAQGLLSNPYIEGETVRLHAEPEQALTLLQKAESVLTTSISENYEQVKSQGGDSSTVSKTDAAAAYYVRGLVHQLASDYYAWTAKRDVEEARQAARRGQDILGDIQQANAGALEYQAVAAMTNVELDKRIAKAKKEAAAARKTVQTIKGQISEAEKRIAALQEQIEADSFKAATLRAESEQLPTEEGREKLKQAWTYRDKVHEANEEIDTLEETILQHRARLKEAEHKRAGAEGKLEGLAAVAKEQDRVAQGNTTKFNTQKQTVSQRAGELATAMKNAGESAAAARALIGQAEGRLQTAQRDVNHASTLAPEAKEAQINSALADVQMSLAENHLELAFLRDDMQRLTERIDSVWENLYAGKPDPPTASALTEFIASTERSLELADEAYVQSIQLQKDAVQAADSGMRWSFQHDLAAKYLSHADVLQVLGEGATMEGAVRSAKQVLTEAMNAAPGKQAETMRDLQKAIARREQAAQ